MRSATVLGVIKGSWKVGWAVRFLIRRVWTQYGYTMLFARVSYQEQDMMKEKKGVKGRL
jgi:hypothetical protein